MKEKQDPLTIKQPQSLDEQPMTRENWEKHDNPCILCSQPRKAGRPVDAMESWCANGKKKLSSHCYLKGCFGLLWLGVIFLSFLCVSTFCVYVCPHRCEIICASVNSHDYVCIPKSRADLRTLPWHIIHWGNTSQLNAELTGLGSG